MPFVQIREFGDDAKLLAGGRIWFYELGSTTPKTVWTDIAMTTPATNPVVLSASGSAKIFCDGAYSYKIERFVSGVYVEQQTGDFTTSASADSGLAIFQDYDALEASDGSALVAAVIDGFNAGDKAGGIFFRDNSQTTITTDGVVVVGPTFKYIRAYSNTINAEWCGVQWNGLAQGIAVNRALGASIAYGQPVFFDLPFQIEQTIQVQAGASVILGDQCRISGSIVANWNFVQGSQLVSCAPGAFGPNVRPRFDTGVYEFLRLSWCKGATDDETLAQFLGMPNTDFYTLVVDKSLDDARTNFALPGKTSARFEGGRIRFTTGACSITINAWETPPLRQVFEFASAPVIGSIVLPEPARPEWFGAVGNGSDDDTVPVRVAVKSNRVRLKNSYKVFGFSSGTWCELYGEMIQEVVSGAVTTSAGLLVASGTVTFTNLAAENCAFTSLSSSPAISCAWLNASFCSFSGSGAIDATATAGARLTNCILDARTALSTPSAQLIACLISDDGRTLTETPIVDVRGARLGGVTSAELLYTDADGDVMGVGPETTRTINIPAASMVLKQLTPSKIVADVETVADAGTITGNKSVVKFDTATAANPLACGAYMPSHASNQGMLLTVFLVGTGEAYFYLSGTFVGGQTLHLIHRSLADGAMVSARFIATSDGWAIA